jgi:undecaprenyl diphosphate synthase
VGIEYLTLFAFSSENWRRPQEEVKLLMQLFVRALKDEVKKLDRNGVCLRVVGDLSRFEPELQALIRSFRAANGGQQPTGADDCRELRWTLGYPAGGQPHVEQRPGKICADGMKATWRRIWR